MPLHRDRSDQSSLHSYVRAKLLASRLVIDFLLARDYFSHRIDSLNQAVETFGRTTLRLALLPYSACQHK